MKQEFGYFLKNAKFRAALGLTLLLSYGYAIATTRVSIDSLEGDRYIGTGGVMLSTGRFGMNLWAAVLGYGRAEPSYAFGIDLLRALLLALAAVSFWCAAAQGRAGSHQHVRLWAVCLPVCLLPADERNLGVQRRECLRLRRLFAGRRCAESAVGRAPARRAVARQGSAHGRGGALPDGGLLVL